MLLGINICNLLIDTALLPLVWLIYSWYECLTHVYHILIWLPGYVFRVYVIMCKYCTAAWCWWCSSHWAYPNEFDSIAIARYAHVDILQCMHHIGIVGLHYSPINSCYWIQVLIQFQFMLLQVLADKCVRQMLLFNIDCHFSLFES